MKYREALAEVRRLKAELRAERMREVRCPYCGFMSRWDGHHWIEEIPALRMPKPLDEPSPLTRAGRFCAEEDANAEIVGNCGL